MLHSQRHHFAIPLDVAYLDAASITPRPMPVRAVADALLSIGDAPWSHDGLDKAPLAKALRERTAALIGAQPQDMAIVCAVSYAMATAARNIGIEAGRRVLMLADDHPSAALVWGGWAQSLGAVVDIVARPLDGDWTSAVLEAIERPGAPPVGLAVLPPLHWTDGTLLDLPRAAAALRRQESALVVDATQAAGILPLDVADVQPDFLAFPAYKWLFGPYGTAYLHAAPHRQDGVSLEQHMGNRRSVSLKQAGTASDFAYLPGAQRYDRGEREDRISMGIAVAGLELLQSWDATALRERLRSLTDRLVERLDGLPLKIADRRFRAPHILGLTVDCDRLEPIVADLRQQGVFLSPRRGFVRVAPHAYNEEQDIDRLADRLRSLLR